MKRDFRLISFALICFAFFTIQNASAQSVLDPADVVITYNPASPPVEPAWGQIGKWVRTVRLGWNTSAYKAYIYKGNAFRLKFPKTYNPASIDGKKYPLMIFFHGLGEATTVTGANTDNEFHLYHGAQFFSNSVDNGKFDGYVLLMQSSGSFGPSQFNILKELIEYLVQNNKLDRFQVTLNGLSAGGQACWQMMEANPSVVAASLPMSWTSYYFGDAAWTNKLKFTPIWNFQGGQDGNPAPGTSAGVRDNFLAAGGNYRYTLYPTLGHGTWDSAWLEPDFWGYQQRAYASNAWPLFGKTEFCPGEIINTTLGVAPEFDEYEWRKDGSVIQTGLSNTLNITSLGTYDVRVRKGTEWSDWSKKPVVYTIKASTVSPTPQVSGLASRVLPALDGSTTVQLEVPNTYTSYNWQRTGVATSLSNTRFLVAGPGSYQVLVTEQFGCTGNYSTPFIVVDANGPNKPDPAVNLIATALTKTTIRLDWSDNPTPQFNETNFEIYSSMQAGGPYKLIRFNAQDIKTFTINGLLPNTRYYFKVRAVNNSAAADASNEASAITQIDTQAPTPPANLIISSSTRNSVTLKWNASTDDVGVVRYEVFVNGIKTYATSGLIFTVSGLQSPNNYVFSVRAVDLAGNASVLSNQVSGQPLLKGLEYKYYNLGGPSVLPNYNTLSPASTGVMPNVSTSPKTQNENFGFLWEGYINIPVAGNYVFNTYSDDGSRLYLGPMNGQGSPYTFAISPTLIVDNDGGHGATNVYSATLTLAKGTYPFAIAYFNGVGGYTMTTSWKTPETAGAFTLIPDSVFADKQIVNGAPPANPSNLITSTVSHKQINLAWTRNSTNETSFELWRSTSPVANFVTIGQVPAGTLTFKDSTLLPNTKYYYKVRALNMYGESDFDKVGLGVDYAYYEQTGLSLLPDFNTLTPVKTGHVSNFNLGMQNRNDNFALKFSGTIHIPASGIYTFFLTSDDGSKLYIDGFDAAHLVIDHDGIHGAYERNGSRNLKAGPHSIYVTYFESTSTEVLNLKISGTSLPKQNIPDNFLGNGFTMASTLPAPPAPAPPSNLQAGAISRSAVNITWTDNSTNELKYELYRSKGNNATYLLYATLPANTTSFTDGGLFANDIFYYKLRAIGTSNSIFTLEDSAKTWNTAPVIVQLPAFRTAYNGIVTNIQLSAADLDGELLSFSGQNLPAFANLVDHGNRTATLVLNSPAGGTYNNIRVTVSDRNGGTDFTQFNLTVNNNSDPVITSITNYNVNESETLSIPLSASDLNGDNITWSVSNLPSIFTLNSSGNGTSATLSVTPNFGASGNYLVSVNAADGLGGYTTNQFTLTVNDKSPNTKVYMRMKNDYDIGVPWNSILTANSLNLKDENNQTTSVGLNFPSGFVTGNAGVLTGNNSGIYPDAVIHNYFMFGGYSWLPTAADAILTGLDPSKKYSFKVFASSNLDITADNGSTNYTVNGQTQSLYVQNNTKNTLTFNNIVPASNGTITIAMTRGTGAVAGYLNAIVLNPLFDDGTVPTSPVSLAAQNVPEKGVQITWQNTAFNVSNFELQRSQTATGAFSVVGTTNGDVNSFIDNTVRGNNLYYYKLRAISPGGLQSVFSDVVSILTMNRIPSLDPVNNVILNNNQSLNITVSANDDPSDVLTLTASNLPPFVSFTDNGNGSGTISIQPLLSSVGIYRDIIITAKDNNGGSTSDNFDITVVDNNLRSIHLNFTNGPTEGSPWNNLSGFPAAGTTYSNLKDDRDSTWTSVAVNLQNGFTGNGSFGMRAGNGKEIYPFAVSRTGVYETSATTKNIVVSGLSSSRKYNFVFFNSHDAGVIGKTDFSIGGVTVSLEASYNINRTVQINGISPDGTGKVTIAVTKSLGSESAYLNAMIIQSYAVSPQPFVGPTDLRILNASRNSITLQWQDRSDSETNFDIFRATTSGAYQNVGSVAANETSYVDTDPNLVPNTTYYYVVRARKAGPVQSNYSNIATGNTYAFSVYINVSNNFLAGSPWNNLAAPPQVGYVWSNFRDEVGALTSLGMLETGKWAGIVQPGVNTGNNSGVYPDNVLVENYGLFAGQVSSMKVTGLNLSMKYNFTFFASIQAGGDVNTGYTINGKTVLLNGSYNKNGTVTMYDVEPDVNGEVLITIAPGTPSSQFGLLGALVIHGYTPAGQVAPAPPARTTVSPAIVSEKEKVSLVPDAVSLLVHPNPFSDYLNLSISTQKPDRLQVLLFDMNGKLVFQKHFGVLNSGSNLVRIQPGKVLTPGVYLLKTILGDGKVTRTLKVVRN